MPMKSIVSYPDRGRWGKSNWRGNTTGHIIVDLIEQFRPRLFVDVCEGSGTSGDVCKEMGVPYVGLDLHKGNDFTRDFVLSQLPYPADFCFSHIPYWNMVTYSGEVWGKEAHSSDLSRSPSYEEFLEKSNVMLLNQREAVRNGKYYATLVGDLRKNGVYHSLQADFIKMMPSNELSSVVIKEQHNMMSNRVSYSGNFIPIVHEYLLIWKRSSQSLFMCTWEKAKEIKRQIASTWRAAIRIALMKLDGKGTLKEIYEEVEKIAKDLIEKNQHWKAKIRQQLQIYFTSVERGVWSI